VQRVVSPDGVESWTLIGSDLRPVDPVDKYLAWLSSIERAPTTVRAYAHDLKTFWEFVEARGIAWDAMSLEQLGAFTAWLRSPADNVVVLETGRAARAAPTVNRILTAVFGFYEFHARHGVQVARALVDERRMGRGSFKPFLHGIAPARPRGRVGRLRQERRLPQTLTVEQVAAILAVQTRLRDRFLFALLAGTGMRIGQALGLRHSDLAARSGASRSCRVRTTPTAPGASASAAGCPSPASWSGCTPTTCTRSTASWTPTTCS
jgi:integrase/recombinase XerD